MAVKIEVPLRDVQAAPGGVLTLDEPRRCPRCGSPEVGYFESHRLRLRAGQYRGSFNRPAYRTSRAYTLKILICADCYQLDFLTHPETLTRDASPLGRAARFHSIAYTIGALLAALGILMLTTLVPDSGVLGILKANWRIFTATGLVVLLAAWLAQRSRQKKVSTALAERNITGAGRPRAEPRTPVLEDLNDPEAIPLEIGFANETWAEECANRRGWKCERYTAE